MESVPHSTSGYKLMAVVGGLILVVAIKDTYIRLSAGRLLATESYMFWATGIFLLIIAVVALWPKKS